MKQRVKSLVVPTLIGMCIGIAVLAATVLLIPQRGDALSSSIVPVTAQDIINKAEVIVIGEVGPVIQRRSFSGYGKAGELLDGLTVDGNPHPNFQFTDFEVKIEKVLKDNGSVASGKSVILRMLGDASLQTKKATLESEYPLSFTGDRHLFILSHNPDETYGFYYGPWSRLIIDGKTLRVSNGVQEVLAFGDKKSAIELDEFLQLISK